jgi:hypothetical protein
MLSFVDLVECQKLSDFPDMFLTVFSQRGKSHILLMSPTGKGQPDDQQPDDNERRKRQLESGRKRSATYYEK